MRRWNPEPTRCECSLGPVSLAAGRVGREPAHRDCARAASRRWSETPARSRATNASQSLLPGMPNLHSHAFQRGMAGLTEYRGPAADNFWSWRTLMYRFVARMTPEDLEAVTTWRSSRCSKPASRASGNSTTCITIRRASPMRIRPNSRRAWWRRPNAPASRSRCCRCSTRTAVSAARPPTRASGVFCTTCRVSRDCWNTAGGWLRSCRTPWWVWRRIPCVR